MSDESYDVGVIGLGYVGLPLALGLAHAGRRTLGYDVDGAKIDMLRAGTSYVSHIPASGIAEALREGRLQVTGDASELARCDALVICVPTPLTTHRDPDLTFVVATAHTIAAVARRGQLVVLQSTTYPGTTDEVVRPILEAGGMRVGTEIFLAFSPEREDPGNQTIRSTGIPKIVGADDPESLRRAVALFTGVFEQVRAVSSSRVAEMSKLLENVFRSVNIALVNELKVLCDRMGMDVWEVIAAAATKPFGFMPFHPGPGLGGHCIPIDPFYLTWKAREYGMSTRFIELAGEINHSMPAYVVQRLQDALNDQGRGLREADVMVLGVAYKRDINDVRESPALEILELLAGKGARASYHDPFVPVLPLTRRHGELRLSSVPLTAETAARADAVVIVTDHSSVDYGLVAGSARLVVDTRNAMARVPPGRAVVVKA